MWRDLLADAVRNVRVHWLRVTLTGAGIAWGIALFVVLTAMGSAVQGFYREKMESIGRKAVFVFPASVSKAGTGAVTGRQVILDRDDPPRFGHTGLVERVAPELPLGGRAIRGGGRVKVGWTYGVAADTGRIRNVEVARGRFFTPADLAARRRVLVLGAEVADRLFGRRPAVGRHVRLEGHPFRVIGVAVRKGQQIIGIGPPDDEHILLPVTTAQTLFTFDRTYRYLLYEPRTRAEAPASITRVRGLLARGHRFRPDDEEALSFFNVVDRIRPIAVVETGFQLFLVVCGVLTLGAGGVGVMNIMLVAVAERTREIGLRKALGAAPRDIFLGVLGESVVVTTGAGLLGLALGFGLVLLVAAGRGQTPEQRYWVPPVEPSFGLGVLAFVVLVGVGLAAGLVPARRAARLEPSIALRD